MKKKWKVTEEQGHTFQIQVQVSYKFIQANAPSSSLY